jgi:predicted HTH transcriptional regulator
LSLLYKPLESITAEDLQGLIDNEMRESLLIEYKPDLDQRDDEKTRQFLGSVSRFANASGGDLLFGIRPSTHCRSR